MADRLLETMLDWSPSRRTALLLRNLSFAGWLLCLVAVVRSIGAAHDAKVGLEMLLFVGMFPFFIGALLIVQKRTLGALGPNWAPVLFRGLPSRFTRFYHVFFYGVWAICGYLVLREALEKSNWPSFGLRVEAALALIPSAFYLAAAGAFWSEALEPDK